MDDGHSQGGDEEVEAQAPAARGAAARPVACWLNSNRKAGWQLR